METKFLAAYAANREKAAALGVRMCPITELSQAHRAIAGNRVSDGFFALADRKHLELSLEALVIDKKFTGLFSDEEANHVLEQLLAAGYLFHNESKNR